MAKQPTMMDDLQRLQDLITGAKTTMAQAEGRKQEILRRMKEELKLADKSQLEKKLAELSVIQNKLNEEITAEYTKLKAEYEW